MHSDLAPTSTEDGAVIAAVATGTETAAISMIRITGQNTFDLVAPCLNLPNGQKQDRGFEHAKAAYRNFISNDGKVIDDIIVTAFHGPASFTGQDTLEITCHGSRYVVQQIMARLYALGIRQAEPGEFTQRAFLNGKMDLTEAEGIRELIEAQNHHQWLAARQMANGHLSKKIEELRSQLMESLKLLEAMIDFPDEGDTADVHMQSVLDSTRDLQSKVTRLSATFDDGKVAAQGLRVALIGEPNAGKSTLMNLLLQKERAIVTDIAGTTRDYIEEPCNIKGRLIRLFDTAGIRDTADPVESIGVAHSVKLASEADLVLVLVPADGNPKTTEDAISRITGVEVVKVGTKLDLGKPEVTCDLHISATSGDGIDQLCNLLVDRIDSHITKLEDTFISSPRHHEALNQASKSIDKFFDVHADGGFPEMLAFELSEAKGHLEAIIGRIDADDVLGEIFSSFCIGK